uniref:Enhancer of polycomb-like protein n=1 Tax=Steinernema glaseri TaxID=37863 RepID=A0A1I7YNZ3_9BILA
MFNFAKKKRVVKKVKDRRKPSSTAPVIQERLVMRDHEVRLRCLLTASQSALLVANPVGVRDDEWFDDEAEFDLFDYSVEEADDGLAKGLAIIMNGVFSHRPIRSARRYAAYYGVRRNGEKWNPRFYGFDY